MAIVGLGAWGDTVVGRLAGAIADEDNSPMRQFAFACTRRRAGGCEAPP
jgi:hypothetical protein